MSDSAFIGPVEAPQLQVMSYNIRRRLPHVNPLSPDRWSRRQPLMKRILRAEHPSLIGVQEALQDQARFVRKALGDRYALIGHGREANRGGEGCPIFYDRDRLEVLDWEQTALSDTPSVSGSTTWGNRTPRIVVNATFRDLATGIRFQAVNTHFDNVSRIARERSATLVQGMVAASGLPAVVTGDFNTDVRTLPYNDILDGDTLVDCFETAAGRVGEKWGTFPNYRAPRREHKRIDWVLATPNVVVLQCGINVTRYGGGWASDHAAVQAVVAFPA